MNSIKNFSVSKLEAEGTREIVQAQENLLKMVEGREELESSCWSRRTGFLLTD